MKRILFRLILSFVVLVFLTGSQAFAQEKGKSPESPAGWEKGGKKSWETEVPPGASKDTSGKEGAQGMKKGEEKGKKTKSKGEPSVDKKKGEKKDKTEKELEQEKEQLQKGKSKKK